VILSTVAKIQGLQQYASEEDFATGPRKRSNAQRVNIDGNKR